MKARGITLRRGELKIKQKPRVREKNLKEKGTFYYKDSEEIQREN
jgi:hypothetical protein